MDRTVRCLLAQSARFQVAWIRESAAVIGNIVELVDDDRRSVGWRVVSAETSLSSAFVRQQDTEFASAFLWPDRADNANVSQICGA